MSGHQPMDCAQVDALAGAAALGAVNADEAAAMTEHLATCDQPHTELRELLGAGALLAASLEPIEPDPRLRSRVLTTAAATPQDHRGAPAASAVAGEMAGRRAWLDWSSVRLWRGVAATAVVVAIAVGAWNIGLRQQLAVREAALSAIGDALIGGQPAYSVTGPAGSGYVIDTEGPGATFLVAGLQELSAGQIYEMWLLDAAGTPVAVGTIERTEPELAVVALEQDLAGYATFAVTVEQEPVAAPTSTPVMVGALTN